VESADTGQDEDDLEQEIEDLLVAGTQHVWVVRLKGPRRIEVHEPNRPMRKAFPGEQLKAPGILDHPVSVETLYDLDLAPSQASIFDLAWALHSHLDSRGIFQPVKMMAMVHGRSPIRSAAEVRAVGTQKTIV